MIPSKKIVVRQQSYSNSKYAERNVMKQNENETKKSKRPIMIVSGWHGMYPHTEEEKDVPFSRVEKTIFALVTILYVGGMACGIWRICKNM